MERDSAFSTACSISTFADYTGKDFDSEPMASSTSLKSPKQTNLPKGRLVCFGDPNGTCLETLCVSSVTCLLSSPRSLLASLLAKQTAPLALKNAIFGIFLREPILPHVVIWLQALRSPIKKLLVKRSFFIGDPNGTRTHITTVKG